MDEATPAAVPKVTASYASKSSEAERRTLARTPAKTFILSIDNIYDGFDATSDSAPKASQIQVDIGNGQFRYCYLDTRNSGVGYQNPQNIVTYGNKSLIWMRRGVIDENDNRAFLFSNKVTDKANPHPPIGVPNTYMTYANQYAFGAYNLQVLGSGVKFYLEADPTDPDKERIAIFTYMDEQPIDANKYYLQRFTNNSSIVAITGSQLGSAPLYIFRFRSV